MSSDRDEEDVSRIRQEIIDNARTNMAIDERERRIKAKRQCQAEIRKQEVEARKTAAPPASTAKSHLRFISFNMYLCVFLITAVLVRAQVKEALFWGFGLALLAALHTGWIWVRARMFWRATAAQTVIITIAVLGIAGVFIFSRETIDYAIEEIIEALLRVHSETAPMMDAWDELNDSIRQLEALGF